MLPIRTCIVITLAAAMCACAQSQPAFVPTDRTAQLSGRVQPAHPIRGTMYVANFATGSVSQLIGYRLRSLELTYSTDDPSLKGPQGITAAPNGAIYVANTYGYNILKFEPPKMRPSQRIPDKGYRPSDVALDSKGNIWVANWCTRKFSCGAGNVREYNRAGTLLQTIACSNLYRPVSLAIDQKDDVVVDGDTDEQSKPNGAAEIPAGSTACVPLPGVQIGDPGGVQFTKDGDLTVIDSLYSIMYTYAKPAFSSVIATTNMYGIPSPFHDAFVPDDDYVWTSVPGAVGMYEFAYPESGNPVNSIYGIYFPAGVAIVPK
jgi:hypothetical protein